MDGVLAALMALDPPPLRVLLLPSDLGATNPGFEKTLGPLLRSDLLGCRCSAAPPPTSSPSTTGRSTSARSTASPTAWTRRCTRATRRRSWRRSRRRATRSRRRGRSRTASRSASARSRCATGARAGSAAGVVVLRGLDARHDQRARDPQARPRSRSSRPRARARRATREDASRCTRCSRCSAAAPARPSPSVELADPLALAALALQDEGRTRLLLANSRNAPMPVSIAGLSPGAASIRDLLIPEATASQPELHADGTYEVVVPAGGLLELDHESDPR